MKPVIIIATAFVLIFVMTSAERVFGYADDEVEIIVSVDKSSYKVGDLLTIKGTGAHSYSIFVDIISPNGDQIADLKFIAAKSGDFSTVWIIPRGLDDGTYTINLRDVKKQTQTTFNIQSVSTTPESIPEIILQLIPEPTPEIIPEPTPELIPEPTPEIIPELIPELIPEPSPEPISDPIPEPISEPELTEPESPQESEKSSNGESIIIPDEDKSANNQIIWVFVIISFIIMGFAILKKKRSSN